MGGGGGSTQVYTPTPAAQPSGAEAINAWVAAMPQVYQTQMQYAPLQAQQQVDLASQYALPLAQAYQQANDVLNPKSSQLQETMANQALAGMNATSMPDWMKAQYRSDYNANLGSNAGSPIGADYVSRGMQSQLYGQQKQYRDLGLQLANKTPMASAQPANTTDYMSGFTPSKMLDFSSSNYGNFLSASRPFAYGGG